MTPNELRSILLAAAEERETVVVEWASCPECGHGFQTMHCFAEFLNCTGCGERFPSRVAAPSQGDEPDLSNYLEALWEMHPEIVGSVHKRAQELAKENV